MPSEKKTNPRPIRSKNLNDVDTAVQVEVWVESAEQSRQEWKKEAKKQIQISQVIGLAQSIVDTANWEDIDRDGLKRVAQQIVETLEGLNPPIEESNTKQAQD